MALVNEETFKHLLAIAKKRHNMMLTGTHGVGKTTLVQRIVQMLKQLQPAVYLSCSTIDPWVDIVGIPVPKGDKLKFVKREDLLKARTLVLDEINRSHPKVQNSLLEIVQFRTVNGEALTNLEWVVAMRNPGGGNSKYQVSELDPAMVDRFKARISLEANPSVDYYVAQKIPRGVAVALVDWWMKDLKDEQREDVTPRTLEAIGSLIADELDWKFAIGDDLGVPLIGLTERLAGSAASKYEGLILRKIARKTRTYSKLAASDSDFAVHLVEECNRSNGSTNYEAARVINALPDEFQAKLLSEKRWVRKMIATWNRMNAIDQCDDDYEKLYRKVCHVSRIKIVSPSSNVKGPKKPKPHRRNKQGGFGGGVPTTPQPQLTPGVPVTKSAIDSAFDDESEEV